MFKTKKSGRVVTTQWSAVHAPAANTIASATVAAGGAGVRHVLQSLQATLINITSANFTANQPVYVVVRDGATGVGTILFQGAHGLATIQLTGANILGSPNTAMTIEYTVAPGATNFEIISAVGYSLVLT